MGRMVDPYLVKKKNEFKSNQSTTNRTKESLKRQVRKTSSATYNSLGDEQNAVGATKTPRIVPSVCTSRRTSARISARNRQQKKPHTMNELTLKVPSISVPKDNLFGIIPSFVPPKIGTRLPQGPVFNYPQISTMFNMITWTGNLKMDANSVQVHAFPFESPINFLNVVHELPFELNILLSIEVQRAWKKIKKASPLVVVPVRFIPRIGNSSHFYTTMQKCLKMRVGCVDVAPSPVIKNVYIVLLEKEQSMPAILGKYKAKHNELIGLILVDATSFNEGHRKLPLVR